MLSSHKSVKWTVTAIAVVASMMLVAAAAHAQTTWHVDDDNCPGPGDGSIGNPYCLIQDAIVAAAASGDEIIVETGTYNEAINLLGKAVTLRSTDPNNPVVVAATILDGTALGTSIITCDSGEGPGTVIDGLTITNGSVPTGGGMFNFSSSPTVINCTFIGNSASVGGGGGMSNLSISSPTVTNCTFSNNSATTVGGGMFNNFSFPTVTNCTFSGNSAVGGGGGGMYNNSSSPAVINTTFSGNSVTFFGGGMFNSSSNPTLTNCTFSGNTAFAGAAIYNFSSTSNPTVTNCILWGNTVVSGDPSIGGDGVPTVTYSDIEGGFRGTGNIEADPFFVDADGPDDMPGTEDDNLRLLPGSPCIDVGNNSAVPNCMGIDLDGNPRFVDDPDTPDGGVPDCASPIVDMGAYEFQGVSYCTWDLNGNGTVGILDLLALLAAWGPNPGHPADFDGDGTVGILDLLALLANWGPCP